MKKKKKKTWTERQDTSELTKDDKRIPIGILRSIVSAGKPALVLIPDSATKLDSVAFEQFMEANQILVRFLARERSGVCADVRAFAAAKCAWDHPVDAITHAKEALARIALSVETREFFQEELELDQLIAQTFPTEDFSAYPKINEIIDEIWEKQPPMVIPESFIALPEHLRAKKIDRLKEYTWYLHKKFPAVHPMMRADVASRCADHGAKNMFGYAASDETRQLVQALLNQFESD